MEVYNNGAVSIVLDTTHTKLVARASIVLILKLIYIGTPGVVRDYSLTDNPLKLPIVSGIKSGYGIRFS